MHFLLYLGKCYIRLNNHDTSVVSDLRRLSAVMQPSATLADELDKTVLYGPFAVNVDECIRHKLDGSLLGRLPSVSSGDFGCVTGLLLNYSHVYEKCTRWLRNEPSVSQHEEEKFSAGDSEAH